ncbi:MAG TPA: hypothetical protein VHO29_12990 [Marmoricola sp.]|nr:hypothetical protein [Marmoricola sp.]
MWLKVFLHDEDEPPELGPILAADLYARACAALEDFAEAGELVDEDDPESPRVRLPRRRVFFEVADRLLGPRRHTKRGAIYTITESTISSSATD